MNDSGPGKHAGLVPVILVLVVAGGLHGYELLGPSWANNFATYRVNPNFPPGPAGTDEEVIQAIQSAARAWRNQGETNFFFAYQGTTAVNTVNTQDGINTLFWAPTNPGGGPALATTFYSPVAPLDFIGFDVVFWGENDNGPITWNGVGDAESNERDLAAVATHELGHCLGLSHSAESDATMWAFYGGIDIRTLHPDDVAGVQFLYGGTTMPNTLPQIDDVDPPSGPVAGGNEVLLVGENFTWTADTILRIDGVELPAGAWEVENGFQIRIDAMPPHGAGEVAFEVENELGSVTLDAAYEYEPPPPQVLQVVPATGPLTGGTSVSVLGFSFLPGATVTFGGVPLVGATFVGSSEIQGATPIGLAGEVDVTVTQPFGESTLLGGFLYADDLVRVVSSGVPIATTETTVEIRGTAADDLEAYSFTVDFDGAFVDVTGVSVVGAVGENADLVVPILDNGPEPAGGFFGIDVVVDTTPPIEPIPVGWMLCSQRRSSTCRALAWGKSPSPSPSRRRASRPAAGAPRPLLPSTECCSSVAAPSAAAMPAGTGRWGSRMLSPTSRFSSGTARRTATMPST